MHQPPMKAAREMRCRRQPVRWRRSCCAGERPLCRRHPATTHRHSREGGNPQGGAGHPSPRRSATPNTPDAERRSPCPEVDAGPAPAAPKGNMNALKSRTLLAAASTPSEMPCPSTRRSRPTSPHSIVSSSAPKRMAAGETHTALLEVIQRAPHQEQPPPRLSAGRHPLGQPAQQGTQTAVNQRRIIQQLRQERPASGKQLLFYPPASFKRRQKNTKQSYKGRLIKWHFC